MVCMCLCVCVYLCKYLPIKVLKDFIVLLFCVFLSNVHLAPSVLSIMNVYCVDVSNVSWLGNWYSYRADFYLVKLETWKPCALLGKWSVISPSCL